MMKMIPAVVRRGLYISKKSAVLDDKSRWARLAGGSSDSVDWLMAGEEGSVVWFSKL